LQSPFQRIGRRPLGRSRLSVFLISWAAALAFTPPPAGASPFDCRANRCGIILDAPVKEFVVGTVDGLASPAQTEVLLAHAQAAGLWRLFPAGGPEFSEKIQPISISFAPGHSITVLAGVDETRMLRLQKGELIRYAPHRGLHEKPRPNDPYWAGIGCVAPLCLQADKLCAAGFHAGLYRLSDGAELDESGLRPLPGGVRIDPMSMRPKPG